MPERNAKRGILHDHDLMANAELAASGNVCAICDVDPVRYQWSDLSGEAMCTRCGACYQLKWGSKGQEAEGAYPYLTVAEEWVPIIREYYAETGRFACFGTMLGARPGLREFGEWVRERYPLDGGRQ